MPNLTILQEESSLTVPYLTRKGRVELLIAENAFPNVRNSTNAPEISNPCTIDPHSTLRDSYLGPQSISISVDPPHPLE